MSEAGAGVGGTAGAGGAGAAAEAAAETCARFAAEVALLEQAEEVVVLDLRGLASFTDFFVIATARSERRRATVVEAVERRVRERFGRKPNHLEGYPAAGWLLGDYVDFVVHVFSPESRELYQLEKLWGDAARWFPEPPAPPEADAAEQEADAPEAPAPAPAPDAADPDPGPA